jgi:hypothetical protein
MNNVVQLEAFESSIKGRRIRWFLPPGAPSVYPAGFVEQIFTETPNFQRRILLTHALAQESWKLTDRWDYILQPQSPMEWSLVLTLLLNLQTKTLVVCTPDLQVPSAFFTRCSQLPKQSQAYPLPTICYFQTLASPLPPDLIRFDATFYPPAKAVDESLMEAMQLSLERLMSADKLGSFIVKDALKDLRGAGATLVVSSIEDPDPYLYWYYASEQKVRGKDLLTSVVFTLLNRST